MIMAKGVEIGSKYENCAFQAAIKYAVNIFTPFFDSKKALNPRTCPECMKHIEIGISIDDFVFHEDCILKICYEKKLLKRPN